MSQSLLSPLKKRHFFRAISSVLFTGVVGVGVGVGAPAHADTLLDEPLSLSERSPLAQRFNLPGTRSGDVLNAGETHWRFGVDLANNYVRDNAGAETLIFDGELQRYEFGVRYGLGSQWEVGIMLPWMTYRGGVLDSFINRWHSAWGLPDHDRSNYPSDKLQFTHTTNGKIDFNFDRAQSGFGDVQLQIANQILETERNRVALITSVNLPTGDDDKLTGGGGTSIGVFLAATHSGLFELPLTLSGNIGAQSLPDSDVLSDRQKSSAWFGSGEIAWAYTADTRLRAQLSMHSAIYDSALASLGDNSTQLLLGGSVRLDPHWVLDVALSEDVALDTAPDISLQLALKARY
ncbi:MAG: DUF3187 family protein [Spongiibacteraceae bacterium]